MIQLRFIFLAVLFFFSTGAVAQTVQVLEEDSREPIRNVYIYSNENDKGVVTNANGEADISGFSESQELFFQHPSYEQQVFSRSELEQSNYVVLLNQRTVALGELYISASKREQDETEIVQRITQIGNQEIGLSNPQTSADLLESSGKVFVQRSQMGGGSPMIRGFAANSVLIAVDGIRMNNAIFRSGNLQNVISVDANALENTEVTFGPGSIIYGSDALGGVMNFQTKDPVLSFTEGESETEFDVLTRYSSANNEQTAHGSGSVGFEKWGLVSSVTYSNFDDLRSGGNFYEEYPEFGRREEYIVRENGSDVVKENSDPTLQRFSGYEQLNLMQKLRYRPNSRWNFSYGFHLGTTSDIPRYDRLIQREQGDEGQLVNAEWYYGPQTWMMNVLEIEHFEETSFYDQITGTFSHQWFQESRNDRKFQDPVLRNREENVDVLIAGVDFDKNWGEDQELYYGVEGVYNYVSSDAMARNIETGEISEVSTRYPDEGSRYTQLAGYAKYTHDLSGVFTMVGGVRYSHVFLDANFSNDTYNFPFEEISFSTGALNGSLGFTYRPVENLQLNLNSSSGFRAPNVDDAAKIFDSEPGTVVVPNSEVDPEYTYNLDFAIIKRFGELARLEVNVFHTWLRDAMVRRPFTFNGQSTIEYDGQESDVEAVVNAGRANIYGFSSSLDLNFTDNISLASSLTYNEGEDQTNNQPLRHVAPLFGQVEVAYSGSETTVELYSQFNAEKPISDFSPSERSKSHLYTEDGSPGWATLNFKGTHQITENWQINAGIENIFDKHYRPYSSGISAPGRNFIIGLRAAI